MIGDVVRSASLTDRVIAALADAWALIAPVDCAGCGAADRALCRACAAHLRPSLRRALLEGPTGPLPVVAALGYEGAARRALLALKAEGRTELARPLAVPLLAAVTRAWRGSGATALVPVPGSRSGTAQRGFAPTSLIARRAGLITCPALVALDHGPQQKGRRLDERLADDRPRFRVRRAARARLVGARVVLVDDVVTSGGTLRAAARALEQLGARVEACAAIAATPRRHGASSIPWRSIGPDDQGPGDNVGREGYREGKEA